MTEEEYRARVEALRARLAGSPAAPSAAGAAAADPALVEALEEKIARRELDLTTILEIGKQLGSSLEFEAIADVTLLTVIGNAGAMGSALFLPDGEHLVCRASKGLLPDGVEEARLPVGILADRMEPFEPNGALTGCPLAFPLRQEERPVGLLVVGERMEGEEYSEGKKKIMEAFSGMAGQAIANALQHHEVVEARARLDEKVKQLTALFEVSEVINRQAKPEEIANLVGEALDAGFGVREGGVYLRDPDGLRLVRRMGERELPARVVPGEGPLGAAAVAEGPTPVGELDVACPFRAGGELQAFVVCLGALDKDLPKILAILGSQIGPSLAYARLIAAKAEAEQGVYFAFVDRLEREVVRARDLGAGLALVALHIEGEADPRAVTEALRGAAERVQVFCGDEDWTAVLARDLLTVVLPGKDSFEAGDFASSVGSPEFLGFPPGLAISARIATLPGDAEDGPGLLAAAGA